MNDHGPPVAHNPVPPPRGHTHTPADIRPHWEECPDCERVTTYGGGIVKYACSNKENHQ